METSLKLKILKQKMLQQRKALIIKDRYLKIFLPVKSCSTKKQFVFLTIIKFDGFTFKKICIKNGSDNENEENSSHKNFKRK